MRSPCCVPLLAPMAPDRTACPDGAGPHCLPRWTRTAPSAPMEPCRTVCPDGAGPHRLPLVVLLEEVTEFLFPGNLEDSGAVPTPGTHRAAFPGSGQ